jgi:hydrogenase/urease accessory protein HupE
MVAFAVDLPVVPSAAVVGAFVLLRGHAHESRGHAPESEISETGGFGHVARFALATVTVHGLGITFAISARRFVRPTGTACVAVGVGLSLGVLS